MLQQTPAAATMGPAHGVGRAVVARRGSTRVGELQVRARRLLLAGRPSSSGGSKQDRSGGPTAGRTGGCAPLLCSHKSVDSTPAPSPRPEAAGWASAPAARAGAPAARAGRGAALPPRPPHEERDYRPAALPPRPPHEERDYRPAALALRSLFRREVQKAGGQCSEAAGYAGLLAEVAALGAASGGSAARAQELTVEAFRGVFPAWLPAAYRASVNRLLPKGLEAGMFAAVTAAFFEWLVGPLRVLTEDDLKRTPVSVGGRSAAEEGTPCPSEDADADADADGRDDGAIGGQAVLIERCRFLEDSGPCAAVCINHCKVPTERWFREDFGVALRVTPNYDDYSCVFAFGVEPLDPALDTAFSVPCFATCPSRSRQDTDAVQCGDVSP